MKKGLWDFDFVRPASTSYLERDGGRGWSVPLCTVYDSMVANFD